jgi:hypothetical protein
MQSSKQVTVTAVEARRLLWTGRPAWFERVTDGSLVILCKVNSWKGTDNDAVMVGSGTAKQPEYSWPGLSELRRREDCDQMREPFWLLQARASGRYNGALEALLNRVSVDTQRCSCGDPVAADRLTCGADACKPAFEFDDPRDANEAHRREVEADLQQRRRRRGFSFEDSADRAERALGVE